ncbi:hypothetical protein GCM10028778_16290 [Barrientosiimonas marina]|uniref:CPBP family intramembrane metalloprotease n=1 Tax=Lentibacillus kimchii TaxID=1542911 RepID=A0ABW2UTL5_9BACI
MTSWTPWLIAGMITAVLIYAILSIYLRRSIGLYLAAVFHVFLGILSLPSIGLYVLGLAILELITGVTMSVKMSAKKAS